MKNIAKGGLGQVVHHLFSARTLFILLVLFLLTFVIPLSATNPTTVFSADREAFIKELGDFMKKSNNQLLTETFNNFEKYFKAGAFDESEVGRIIEISNKMLEHKVRPNPVFNDYLTTLLFIKERQNGAHHFSEWHSVLLSMLDKNYKKKTKQFKNYVDFSTTLFSGGVLKTGQRGNAWIARDAVFHLENSDGKFFVNFKKLDLVTIKKDQELIIHATSGRFDPETKIWTGNGGHLDWNLPGMENTSGLLKKYSLKLSGNLIKIDTIYLVYPGFFPDQQIAGSYENKMKATHSSKSTYPHFQSYQKDLTFQQIGNRVKLQGGLKLAGTSAYCYGTAANPASITITNPKNQRSAQALGTQFNIDRKEKICGDAAAVTLYINGDSLHHPSVNLRYTIADYSLELAQGNLPQSKAPFYNSYQGVNIYTNKINWKVGLEPIQINEKNPRIANGNKKVKFESLDFFDTQTYRKMQNVADHNPVAVLKLLSDKLNQDTLNANVFAKRLNTNFSTDNIRTLIYEMVSAGFIAYAPKTETITVLPRLRHFADAAQNRTDYDLIRFYSESDETNAMLDLKSNNMLVKGIKAMEFSDRHKVAAKPHEGQMILEKDRDVNFDGKIFAGNTSFTGKDFLFQYQPNQLVMDSIRYFEVFTVEEGNGKKGDAVPQSLASRIEHLSGVLLIDAPDNKSGKEDIKGFPSFNSKGSSYIYYDHEGIQEGTYNRDSFYVSLNEFHLNGMDEITADKLKFDGHIISAGIFPEITESIKVQADGSLGMTTETPENGFPTYSDKGVFTGKVSLDNKGFTANGSINYQGATIQSDDIVLKPEQLLSSAQIFELEEISNSVRELPDVSGKKVLIDWQPYKDSMYITATEDPFVLFNNKNATLKDQLILTPDGLKGRGIFDWDKGQIDSELFSFGAKTVTADTSDLLIKAPGMDHLALNTKNVFTKIDFKNAIGTVRANADSVYTELPYNTYITSMNEFDWDMNNETINFKADEDGRGSFKSTNKKQDGLTFWGREAFYNLKTYELRLGGVSRIETADAYVVPDSGRIEIMKMGEMKTLTNASIIANMENEYHIIRRATVDISGRRSYRASGFYEYNLAGRKQELELTEILGQPTGKGKKSACLTTATGNTIQGQPFYIDHKIQFQGAIALNANVENLDFDGFARLEAEKLPDTDWFSVTSRGDKLNLKLSYNELTNKKGQSVFTGIFINPASGILYPAVMNSRKNETDYNFFDCIGLMDYAAETDEFFFGDSLRIVSGTRSGNLLSYDNKKGVVKAEGTFNMLGEEDAISGLLAGQTEINYAKEEKEALPIRIQTMAGFDFYLPGKLMKIIEADFIANAYNGREINYLNNKEFYRNALAAFIPAGKARTNTRARMLNLGLQLPEKYDYPFVFADIELEWNEVSGTFVTAKNRMALASVNGSPINKMIEGNCTFTVLSNGEKRIKLLITTPGNANSYYFEYEAGVLLTVSTNEVYNKEVDELKKKDRVKKTKKGQILEIALTHADKLSSNK